VKYDLHVHSKYSFDGIMEPRSIVKTAIEKGLDGIAITDHNTIEGGLMAKKYSGKSLEVIIGSEISTERGELIGLFVKDEIKSRDSQKVIEEIKSQSGIVVIPHPFDRLRRSTFSPDEDDARVVHCIEGFNSRCLFLKYNLSAIEFAVKFRLAVTAGSDAHLGNEIGNGITELHGDPMEALSAGKTKIYGRRSWPTNHGLTKLLKWIKRVEGSSSEDA